MGRRQRQRARAGGPDTSLGEAPVSEYTDAEGNVLALRGSLTPATRRQYAETLGGGLHREDALQRAIELLFERLAVSWTIAGLQTSRQKELLARYRMASSAERTFVRESLRAHLAEHFPELEAPVIDADAFAALLCDWCLEVRPGQQVLVNSTTLGESPLRAMHRALLERDAWPLIRMAPPWLAPDFHRHARERHLDGFPAVELAEMEAIDAFLRIDAPANTAALAGVDPALIARVGVAHRPVQETRLSKRWCGTLWPTPALAQMAGMADDDYAAFVRRALFLDRDDPLAAWQELSDTQAVLVRRLAEASELRVEAEGTDITLDVTGRTWLNSDGRRNMPSGEVFTGPHEHSANGTIRFTVPTGPRGVTVTGVALTFADGEVVSATAEQGDDYLQAALKTDDGARFLGEVGIGTNAGIDRPTGHMLLDEKMAGTVHLALGRSYPESGGTNVSALHWDLLCDLRDGGRITADGEPIVQDGAVLTAP